MKALKIIGKIILVIIIIIILFAINVLILSTIPFGITLPWGWYGGHCSYECCDYSYNCFGFPFSVLINTPSYDHSPEIFLIDPPIVPFAPSDPPSFNIIAFVLNFIFLIILTGMVYFIFRRRTIKKQNWKFFVIGIVLAAIACGVMGYCLFRLLESSLGV